MDANILQQTVNTVSHAATFMNMPLDKAVIVIAFTSLLSSTIIGLGQGGLIIWGLWQMKRSSNERDKQLAQQDRKLDVQDRKLDVQDRKTDKLIETLGLQTQALQTLLERTAPPASEGARA